MRTLRRTPAFTAVALLTLALGIGANTAIYQLFDAIRLRTLPVKDPQQIAIVELADLTRWQGRRTTGYPVLTNPLWEQFRDHQQVFAGRAGLGQRQPSARSRRRQPALLADSSSAASSSRCWVSSRISDVCSRQPTITPAAAFPAPS